MIPFEEALEIIKSLALPRCIERVDLFNALNRILADDIYSDIAMPPFNKSAMDGFACRKSDIKNELQIIEEIAAGNIPTKTIGKDQCTRIMTGAMVPEGADMVVMKENIEMITDTSLICKSPSSKSNICYLGEDVKAGELVLRKGDLLKPSQIAILASVGCDFPMVYEKPTVAIISTGNELVEPHEIPGISKIRNSNGYQLFAQVRQLGFSVEYLGIVSDDEESLVKVLKATISNYRVTILSGGVSVGDFDFVPKVLNELKVNIKIHGIDIRPGKHQLFGERGYHFVFGMPGNPVSSFVQFELLVKPFLKGLNGQAKQEPSLLLSLEEDYNCKNSKQMVFIPATITEQSTVLPLEYHGSAHIHAYTNANAIIEIPKGILILKKGELVRVRPV